MKKEDLWRRKFLKEINTGEALYSLLSTFQKRIARIRNFQMID
jgi:hypothetical protein